MKSNKKIEEFVSKKAKLFNREMKEIKQALNTFTKIFDKIEKIQVGKVLI